MGCDGAAIFSFSPRELNWQEKMQSALDMHGLVGYHVDLDRCARKHIAATLWNSLVHAHVVVFGRDGSPLLQSIKQMMPADTCQPFDAFLKQEIEMEGEWVVPGTDCFA